MQMKFELLHLLLTAGLLALAAPASAQSIPTSPATTTALRPGDLLRVTIWREPDLSGEFLVDERGISILPLLGPQEVAGREIETLRQQLQAGYAEHLDNPSVTITPLKQIFVLGEVLRPGAYHVDPTVSLRAALAMAGGTSQGAAKDRVRIINVGGEVRELKLTEMGAHAPLHSGDEIRVPLKSWLSRNAPFLVSMSVGTLTSIVIGVVLSNQ